MRLLIWVKVTQECLTHPIDTVPPAETSSESTEETNSALISELLSIQVDLESYQQDKQQLQ